VLVLQVIQGPDRGKVYELPANEPQLIGRSSEALPISDTTVSRRHAELTPDDGRWYLRDLESANGTFVNGHRIAERVQLQAGDQVRCGSTLFVLSSAREDRKTTPIDVLPDEVFDINVQNTAMSKAASNDDSMVLGSPDPSAAASGHLRLIYKLTELTATILDREELLNRVMELIFAQFQPDRGFIVLLKDADAAPEQAVVRYRTRPKSVDEGRIPVSRTIIRHALQNREGVLSTNAMDDTRFRSGDSVYEYGIRSAICVPILAGERIFGVIHIDSSLANFTFTEPQLHLLTAIGQHTGLALRSVEAVDARMHNERLAAIGQTVASLSHSIKNILQGLRGGADAVELAINREDLSLAREGWPILARNLDRIYTLTANMLAYSKPRELEIELTDVHKLIREVMELMQRRCDEKSVALLFDPAEHMPPIPTDVDALHQALMNLLTNALEAVPAKKGAISIASEYDASEHEARITVADNGPGVPETMRESIFEPFHSTKGQRGTGLGLSVSRKIVREHGGDLVLAEPASANGAAGATFIVSLPVDRSGFDLGDTSLPRPLASEEINEQDF